MSVDLLFLLAIVAFWVLQQLASRRQQQAPPPVPRDPEDAEPSLGDALSEIRRSLGMEPEPRPVPRRDDGFRRIETGRPDTEERFERQATPRTGLEDRFEQRRSATPTYDEPFERAAPYRAMPDSTEDLFERGPSRFRSALEGHSHIAPVRASLDKPLPTPARRAKPRRLATREQLREAFVLKEIVGPPRAVKREIR